MASKKITKIIKRKPNLNSDVNISDEKEKPIFEFRLLDFNIVQNNNNTFSNTNKNTDIDKNDEDDVFDGDEELDVSDDGDGDGDEEETKKYAQDTSQFLIQMFGFIYFSPNILK